ncbi:hypothetical protein DPEC_G00268120 [Dallia pectoralis]|uniref:Uncharacterized protein n=1 Tax=Dallia pectoralis TaxID=75939 RepID=A0ACC2FNS5_DALPE|nr:hypothetical protein DPEC_G00268120 [Dallia pectoralis]
MYHDNVLMAAVCCAKAPGDQTSGSTSSVLFEGQPEDHKDETRSRRVRPCRHAEAVLVRLWSSPRETWRVYFELIGSFLLVTLLVLITQDQHDHVIIQPSL